ncbi:hypothetical protein [Mesorhizobium loti]|uniref:hypothetical protein n=1 Tax=Rhizobium loti TaxID=381 RepID=UPI00147366C9|nr:hypothetical protein [Mesorhizobium loti]
MIKSDLETSISAATPKKQFVCSRAQIDAGDVSKHQCGPTKYNLEIGAGYVRYLVGGALKLSCKIQATHLKVIPARVA